MRAQSLWPILFLLSFSANANRRIERINFFPEADAYLHSLYSHTQLQIEVPQTTVNTKELNNIYNLFKFTYAQRTGRKMFIGVSAGFEEASENAAIYGIPLRRRFTSSGFMNPALFSTYRLRHQRDDSGNIDAHLSYSPNLGPRKISKTTTNRFTGRDAISFALSHGFHEEKWEFKNQIGYTYWAAGREENSFSRSNFRLENIFQLDYNFTTQYAIRDELFINLTLGIFYRSNERLRESSGEMRELKSGSGSNQGIGLKRTFGEWSMVELSYFVQRHEYFLKAESFSLDGDFLSQSGSIVYTVLF